MNFQNVGLGTAPTEMMDIFGLGTKEKDIVISLATENTVKDMMAEFGINSKANGIITAIPTEKAYKI